MKGSTICGNYIYKRVPIGLCIGGTLGTVVGVILLGIVLSIGCDEYNNVFCISMIVSGGIIFSIGVVLLVTSLVLFYIIHKHPEDPPPPCPEPSAFAVGSMPFYPEATTTTTYIVEQPTLQVPTQTYAGSVYINNQQPQQLIYQYQQPQDQQYIYQYQQPQGQQYIYQYQQPQDQQYIYQSQQPPQNQQYTYQQAPLSEL